MRRERFERLVREAFDSLPEEFRRRIENVAIVVEDVPRGQEDPGRLLSKDPDEVLLMGEFIGIPQTARSCWDVPAGPDHVMLYEKNIEAVCATDDEIREEIRLTLWHELGHYFGMTEDQLEDI